MRNYYDILNLNKTCTSKEIKDSFIKLSKLYHPDKNQNSNAHKKFVEINEAYSVLGKASTRCRYDESLTFKTVYRPGPSPSTVRYPFEQYAHMHSSNLRRDHTSNVGFVSPTKVKIFFICCLLMMIGSGIRLRAESKKRRLKNMELLKYFKESKERTKRIGREQRIKELKAAFEEKKKANIKK